MALAVASGNRDVKLNRDGTPCRVVKRSKIWEIFTIVPDDPSKAICTECNGVISRGGGTGKSQCTTNLWKHIQNRHPAVFDEIQKFKEVAHRIPESNISKIPKILDTSVFGHPEASRVWELFTINESDPSLANCLKCDVEITRSDDDSSTDALWYHLMASHPDSYTKCVTEAIENVVLKNKGSRRSSVWEEFTQHPLDLCKVICNTCETVVSRGTSRERLNTTNMRRHLVGNLHVNALRSKGLLEHQSEIIEVVNTLEKAKKMANVVDGDTNQFSSCNGPAASEMLKSSQDPKLGDSAEISGLINANAVVRDRRVDLIHTGLIGNALYEQQKIAKCCDFTIVVRYKPLAALSTTRKASPGDKTDEVVFPATDYEQEHKIHSCIACIVSDKLRAAVESGSDKLTLIDISKDAIPAFVEVMYTGKLGSINSMRKQQLQELYDLAKLLLAPTVIEYLKRSHPKLLCHIATDQQERSSISLTLQRSNRGQTSPAISSGDGVARPDGFASNINSSSLLHPLETDGVEHNAVRHSETPKVNKRKNYMPISTGNSSKMPKLENRFDVTENERNEAIRRFSSNASANEEVVS